MTKLILIIVVLLSCNTADKKKTVPLPTETLDTIKSRPATLNAKPVLFEAAFISGTQQKVNDLTYSLYGINIGNIKVASGRLIACDPMHIEEYGKPFTQVFPTGEFPIQLSIARLDDEEEIAFARIKFTDEPVASWQFALLEGQEQLPLGQKKRHGYSVDAGIGIFIDAAANKVLTRSEVENSDGEVYKAMEKHNHHTWRYALYNFGAHNLAAFTSGFGDGYYSTYIGFDANGKPARLLTDFGVCEWRGVNRM